MSRIINEYILPHLQRSVLNKHLQIDGYMTFSNTLRKQCSLEIYGESFQPEYQQVTFITRGILNNSISERCLRQITP